MSATRPYSSIRVIWAIAAKDITDALKNRTTLSVLLSVLFLVGVYRLMPALDSWGQPPNVLVYDAGDSALVAAMGNCQAFELWTGYRSEAQMKEKLADGQVPELGLVIPADFDSGQVDTLQGYVMVWVDEEDGVALQQLVEEEISRLVGRPISIQLEGNVVTMQPDSSGLGLMAGLGMVFVILMVGVSLVPHLILEEKQSRTMDALLVSPAGPVHVTLAKAVAGMFYAVLAALVSLAVNYRLVMQWPLVGLAVFCGALFDVLRVSFSDQSSFSLYGRELALILACAVALLIPVAWRVRRLDR